MAQQRKHRNRKDQLGVGVPKTAAALLVVGVIAFPSLSGCFEPPTVAECVSDCSDLRIENFDLQNRVETLQARVNELTLIAKTSGERAALEVDARKKAEDAHRVAVKREETAKEKLARMRAGDLFLSEWEELLTRWDRPISKAKLVTLLGRPDGVKKTAEAGGFLNELWTYNDKVLMEENSARRWNLVASFTGDKITLVRADGG